MSYQEAGIAEDASDRELVERARDGGSEAVQELWERHAKASHAAARRISSSFDSDDLVQEAFTRTLTAIRKGMGPTGPFRPYLYAAIRNIAASWARRGDAEPVEETPEVADPTSDFSTASLDKVLAARAFRTLPDEWRTVLWYADVEDMGSKEIAPLVGISPGAVASLTYRAREGLRRAWIQAHISDSPADDDCQWVVERIPQFLRSALPQPATDRVQDHLPGCARCTHLLEELDDVGKRLRAGLLPLVLGAKATGLGISGTTADGEPPPSTLPELGGPALASTPSVFGTLGSLPPKTLLGALVSIGGVAAVTAAALGAWQPAGDTAPHDVAGAGIGIARIATPPPGRDDDAPPSNDPEGPDPAPTAVLDEPHDDTTTRDTQAGDPAEPTGQPEQPVRDGDEAGSDGSGSDGGNPGDSPVNDPANPGPDGPETPAGPSPDEPAPGPDDPDPDTPDPAEPDPSPSDDDPGAQPPVVTEVIRDQVLPLVHGIAAPGELVEAVTTTGEVVGHARVGADGTFVLHLDLSTPAADVFVRVAGGDPALPAA